MHKYPALLTIALSLTLVALPHLAHARHPASFEAVFDLYRNGKLAGVSTITFKTNNGNWSMSSETRGTKGLARLMSLREKSVSKGTWADDYPRPDSFHSEVKATLVNKGWDAEFDWQAGTVKSTHEDGVSNLALKPGVLDPIASGLALRMGLAKGETEWTLLILDEDEIDTERFGTQSTERISTAIGCTRVYKVNKIRHADSSRYTETYFAPDHDHVPVLLIHGKKGGDHMESRIKSLTINGKKVKATPDC